MDDHLVSLNFEAFVGFFAVLAVLIAATLWRGHRQKLQARDAYFAQFNSSELRMSPYKVGLVYRMAGTTQTDVIVVPIWDAEKPIAHGQEQQIAADHVIAFDPSRFA